MCESSSLKAAPSAWGPMSYCAKHWVGNKLSQVCAGGSWSGKVGEYRAGEEGGTGSWVGHAFLRGMVRSFLLLLLLLFPLPLKSDHSSYSWGMWIMFLHCRECYGQLWFEAFQSCISVYFSCIDSFWVQFQILTWLLFISLLQISLWLPGSLSMVAAALDLIFVILGGLPPKWLRIGQCLQHLWL